MSRASRLINHLDRLLSRHATFGDNPDDFINPTCEAIAEDVERLGYDGVVEYHAAHYEIVSGARAARGRARERGKKAAPHAHAGAITHARSGGWAAVTHCC